MLGGSSVLSRPHLCLSPDKLVGPAPSASLPLLSLSLLFPSLFSLFSLFALTLPPSLSPLLFSSLPVFVWVWFGGARGEEVERRQRQEEVMREEVML